MADLFPIAEARGPKTANVIFFHGLGGDAHGAWSADPKDKASLWPAWLAQDIEGLSVYSVGYEASVSGWNGSAMELTDRAANVLNLLLVNPDLGAGELILVGHSLGGLVIKQVLRKAADEAADGAEASSFIERVRKVAFLATPHAGSDLAGLGDRLRVLIEPSAATRSLLRNDQHLRDLNLWYRRWARQRGIDHLILTETKTTSLFGMIVKPDSSDPGLSSDPVPIDTDHIDIAKPLNRESEVYQLVLNFIKRHTERPVSHEEIRIDGLKGPLEKPIDRLLGWTASFERVRQRFGLPVAILLALSVASGFVLWNWDHIAKIPFVPESVTLLRQHVVPVPRAEAGRLTIAVAHLARDDGLEHERLLRDQLDHFEGVKTLPLDYTLDPDQPDKKKSEEEARSLLKKDRADVLIWGSVVSLGSKSYMRLYWTPSREVSGAKASDRYQPTETIALPEAFWSDLKQILGLLTQTRLAELTSNQFGHYIADKLTTLIDQVHDLVENKEGVWDPETLAGVRFSLANALELDGEQSKTSKPIADSVELYRKVLEGWSRAQAPLRWAMTQLSLGNALLRLGERESGTARLDDAVAAYREALQVFTPARERVPLQWAATQMGLGNALVRVGEREIGTTRLNDAVAAYSEALQEFTRVRVPLLWGLAQMNLGNALWSLGQRESGTKQLEEARAAYRESLQELTRARVPLLWAMAQVDLGNALVWLGERESRTKQLEEAIVAYREALKENTRERVPFDWAMTQNDLGGALWRIGERESGTKRLDDAVSAYNEAMQEWTHGSVPLLWARSAGNQGIALMLLAERHGDADMAEQALQQLDAAFTTCRDGGDPYKAAYFEPWLPKARALAGKLAQR